MDCKSLMIGDWVMLYDTCWHVSNIYHDGYVILKRWSENLNQEIVYLCKVDCLSPITLTEDIMKANGFEEDSVYFRYFNGEGSVCYDKRNKLCHLCGNICVDGVIYFIHELQHALRLCGLNELADNFKIKLNIQKTE